MLKKTLQGTLLAFLLCQSGEIAAQFVPAQPAVQPVGQPLWTINGQVRTRTEARQGVGTPYIKDSWPAYFTSQRTNLNIGYRWDKMNFNVDLRDVRVWGQDASSISNADGSKLFLHQAWADVVLGTTADTNARFQWFDNFSVKVGRQEIVYDDVRLLGNLDWLQQGRRHDAAIFKFLKKGYDVHAGFAMNQNSDAFTTVGNNYTAGNSNSVVVNGTAVSATPGVVYTGFTTTSKKVESAVTAFPTPFSGTAPSTNGQVNQYKFFQYLYATRKFNQTKISVLAFKDDFQKWDAYSRTITTNPKLNTVKGASGQDSIQTISYDTASIKGRNYGTTGNKINTRVTLGGQINTQMGNVSTLKTVINAGAYYQMGAISDKAGTGTTLNASHAFIYATFTKGKFSVGPGYEFLSGNSANYSQTSATAVNGGADRNLNKNEKFDPLYGTPHRWWGYMDYFYVGTGSPRTGLQDMYLRLKYDHSSTFNILVDIHNFRSASDVYYRKTGGTTFEKQKKGYGQEIDIVANYQFNRFCNLEVGASAFFQTNTLNIVKGFAPDTRNTFNKWGYVMLNIRPDFLFQKPQPITN
jgi:hypothetical protein